MRSLTFYFLSVFWSVLLSLNACKDKNCPPYLVYQLPYTLTPARDTFQLGDTIWIEMDFPDVLTDREGGIENTFADYDFRLELVCERFDIDPPQSKAVSFFDALAVTGTAEAMGLSQSGISYYQLSPIYSDHRYRFKAALMLKQTGVFLLAVSPFQTDLNPFKLNGACDHVRLYIGNWVNNGTAEGNNYHLLQSSPVDVYKNMTIEQFGNGGYCFVVQ